MVVYHQLTMNSDAHYVPGEIQNCRETHIEFNQKETKGVLNLYINFPS
jgi:hypothetical protein